ncbi:MAG: glycosyltransferase family 2 protein [Planctomycetaceae bacterium]|nr:glycosyltransferase family 2 protein [Planctomycetaceae bacterium]MCB9952044.1 glycosyltransferase family 2 protein [Planctomycetaceae bacterium]
MSPTVSVVMSAYNSSAHVRQSVQSVLDQTFRDFEFVIVNDGSTDDTPTILDEIASRDGRVRVIHQENAGLTQALIRGCDEARGQYIARQDDDDWSHPQRFELQVQVLKGNPDICMVSCNTEYVGPNGESLQTFTCEPNTDQATHQLLYERKGPPAHGSVMFRRETYITAGGYRPQFYFGQDSDLWLRMGVLGKLNYVQEVLYRAQRSPVSTSGAMAAYQKRFGWLGHDCHLARLAGEPETAFLDEADALVSEVRIVRESKRSGGAALEMTYLIGSQLVTNGDVRARGYLWNVIRRRPWHMKAWVRIVQSYLTGRQQAAEESVRE